MDKRIYLTTTLPYVNAKPHIGFALEIVQADAIARYYRATGREVFFSTGTDEHGQKILLKAEEAGKPVQEYVDFYAATFETLKKNLNLSYNAFVRTTDKHHLLAAEEMWKRCEKAGDIYKKQYSGLYCVGCERFVTEKDLVNGLCVDHGKAPVTLTEENYFFRFSKYADRLLKYLATPGVIVPEFRREEAIKFVEAGLEDFSISRSKEKMSWGIPVPGDDAQVMYVWFDALTNYISTTGWPEDKEGYFDKFWVNGDTIQFAGKDQVRFQSLIWQAMLMSAGVPTTKQVMYHGFINVAGQKMSKTIGNVLEPEVLVAEYGTDALRYFLLHHITPFEDSDVTIERFKDAYNSKLAGGVGNLTNRILKMAEDALEKPHVPVVSEYDGNFKELVENYKLNEAMDLIWHKVTELDQRIQKDQPFKLVKTDKLLASQIICELIDGIAWIAEHLEIFLPETSAKMKEAIRVGKKPEVPLFARKD